MFTLGIDIGSASSKVVIMENGKEIVSKVVIPLGTGTTGPQQAYETALGACGITKNEIAKAVVTGYGRMNCQYADEQLSELSCHAKGVNYLLPSVRTVIDIGGQDAKAMKIGPNGQLLNFVMNDKCAAGTGRFLEVMARVLDVKIEEFGPISEKAFNPVSISNTCTVFAESEVISHMSSHVRTENIIAGIHKSIAKRVSGMSLRVGKEPDIAMSGGVALNSGVVRAMGEELGSPVLVHPYCQLAGAIGACLVAWEKATKKG